MPITTPNYYTVQMPMFQQAMSNILSITQSFPATVTTTLDGTTPGDNAYGTGLIVRLRIPEGFGMVQADGLEGPITVLSATQFTIPIDTTNFDAFVTPTYQPGANGTPAQVVPTGEVNSTLIFATQNILPYP
jgi:hypothetical protein